MTQRETPLPPATSRRSRQRLNLAKEIRGIQRRAADRDGRIVTIGPLVFFSTDTGDAWLLEPADHLAAKLAVAGDALCVPVAETDADYTIGWQGRYRIDGDVFIYEDTHSRRVTAIRGYPLKLLLRAIDDGKRT